MDDKDIERIQAEILSSIDNELSQKKYFHDKAEEIANYLSIKRKCNAQVDDKYFVFSYMQTSKGVTITAADREKYKKNVSYRPFVIEVEIDNNLSLRENLAAAIEVFIMHISGEVVVEEHEE